jgi:5-methylcytosine-specific restriction endonuclease McrA
MKRTPLRKISDKQKERNKKLAQIEPPADGRCQECGNLPDWRGLSKHHKLFRSKGGTDKLDNLIWVCFRCHSLLHHIKEA